MEDERKQGGSGWNTCWIVGLTTLLDDRDTGAITFSGKELNDETLMAPEDPPIRDCAIADQAGGEIWSPWM